MLDFPNSPVNGQIFTVGGTSWRWDGTKWVVNSVGGGGGGGGGDITSVIAGTGLTGGGDLGDVTLNLGVPVALVNGGTGSTTAAGAATNLGVLPLSGGTLTGALTVNGNRVSISGNSSPGLAITNTLGTDPVGIWNDSANIIRIGKANTDGSPNTYYFSVSSASAQLGTNLYVGDTSNAGIFFRLGVMWATTAPSYQWEGSSAAFMDGRSWAQGVGGSLTLLGRIDAAGTYSAFAGIRASKSSATSGDVTGDLKIWTRQGNIYFYTADGNITNTPAATIDNAGGFTAMNDITLGRTQTDSWLLRPNVAGQKSLNFGVAGGGSLDQLFINTARVKIPVNTWITDNGATERHMVSTDGSGQVYVGYNAPSIEFAGSSHGNAYFSCNTYAIGHYSIDGNNTRNVGTNGLAWAGMWSYAYNNASGRADKIEIETATTGSLAAVNALRPVNFRWREHPIIDPLDPVLRRSEEPGKIQRGFIADEVAEVFGADWGGYDRSEDGHESISYSHLVSVLWGAVQELSAEVRDLREQLGSR